MPAYTIRIGGVDVTENVLLEGINISAVVNGLDHCTLNVASYDASLRPTLNQEVEIEEDDGTSPPPLIFGGLITSAREGAWGGQSADGFDAIVTQVTAHSYDMLAKRRVVNESRPAESLEDRISALRTTYLATYGVTLDPAQATGPTLVAQDYLNRKLNDVFDELSTQTASFGIPYLWEIDADKVLRFYQIGSLTAPTDLIESTLTTTLAHTGDVEVEPSRDDYANRILLKVGTGLLAGHIDMFTANGTDTQWALSYPVSAGNINGYATRGVVWLNGTVNVGTSAPLDIGANPEYTITFSGGIYYLNSLVGAPANGTTIFIEYDAQFPYTVIAEDASEISVNGLVEKIVEAPNIFDRTAAQQVADGELARALEILRTVDWRTRLLGYKPGQRLTIDLPKRNINTGLFLITEVVTENEPGGEGLWRRLKAREGSQFQGSWRNLYLDWLGLNTTQASAGAIATAGSGIGAGYFFFGSVHPQGFQAAPLSSLYLRDDGRWYRKQGGGTTAYGWYPLIGTFADTHTVSFVAINGASAAQMGGASYGSLTLTGSMAGAPTDQYNAVTLTTTTTINSQAQLRMPGTGPSAMAIGQEFDFVAKVFTGSLVTLIRIWCGLMNSSTGYGNADDQLFDNYSFRFSTAAGDTGWRGVVDDQGGSGQSVTSNIGTVAANTVYLLRIRGEVAGSPGQQNTAVFFSVDDGTEIEVNSGLPSASVLGLAISTHTLESGVARSIGFSRLQVVNGDSLGM